jgi:tetratricopeptide (TPR) repeat protein
MAKVCPKCNADNSDLAKYCDQCAAPISPEAEAELAARVNQAGAAGRSNVMVNWVGIIVILAIVGAAGWLLFTSHPTKPGEMPPAATAGMGETADGKNPHAQVSADGMNGDIMKQIADAKAELDKDPLNTTALASLYQMYGMIGRQQQLRPYLDKAYEALLKKRSSLGKDAQGVLSEIVLAALSGQDLEGATGVLQKYQQLDPKNLSIIGMLGDVYFDANKFDDAIKWYTQYLDQAKPEVAGEVYWRVRTDRATMYLNCGKPVDGKDSVQLAISELEYITTQTPALWNAWFNLGAAYSAAKQKDKAKAAWQKALTLSTGEADKWRVEAELAKLEGKEPPPPPANPHGNMGAPGADAANPHGGMDMGGAGGGTANPHGDMGGDGTTANPHGGMGGGGAENPHGGGGSQSGSGV